jgi:FAD/FMN-containing dehydrogenase
MNRRELLAAGLALPMLSRFPPGMRAQAQNSSASPTDSRVRPGDADWPSEEKWNDLNRAVGGRLFKARSPLEACRAEPDGASCAEVFKELKNPYYIGDDATLTQTCGWVDAWTARPAVYAVEARTAQDVAAAVNFARDNRLRLVVKGGGHSYLGTSNAADSLSIWTRRMNGIAVHDAFVPQNCEGRASPEPAVSVGAGAIWMHTYNEVVARHGRYVQGGGCGTVGVAGLVQGGGFGSYSRFYGTAAAGLLEAEVVTADGEVRIANARTHPDLFWALKGGGGGTFGVVTRVTLRTHALPEFFGIALATIQASSDAAFRRLVGAFLSFHSERLYNPHWGELVNLRPVNKLEIQMESHGLTEAEASAIWLPFLGRIAAEPDDFSFTMAPVIRSFPARRRWDPAVLKTAAAAAIRRDDRPGAPDDNIFWSANLSEAGHFLYGFESAWLPAALLRADRREQLADALVAAGKHWPVELHFQKGLAGASAETLSAVRDTPINPAVLDAFVLAIVAGEGPPAFPGLPGHEPDLAMARRSAKSIGAAIGELRKVAPDAGSYVAESGFFEPDWQTSYWGSNYRRLLAIKAEYDPGGLFFVHHGVGSEAWSPDGFSRVAAR